MAWLLDINVLIARVDPGHEFHDPVSRWLRQNREAPIVTCPLTENGFLRIYGNPNYPGGPGSPEAARHDLRAIRGLPTHQFLPDTLSLGDTVHFPSLRDVKPKDLTDLYLLALAAANGLRFATFDEEIPAGLVPGGPAALEVIAGK
ncbi:MAG: TA system VapC family ribonuclease toxin [Terrimicrobiaceae bacterium]